MCFPSNSTNKKCFAASRSKKWREDPKVRMKITLLKKNVHKLHLQDYFLYEFSTINIEHNTNWLSIRLSLVLLRTIALWLQIPSQLHILQNNISVTQTSFPSCFTWRRFPSSLCAICIQHTWRWTDRHDSLISINLRLQNFPSESHSVLQVVRCFCVSCGSQDHATRSRLRPYKSISHFENPYFLRLVLISSSIGSRNGPFLQGLSTIRLCKCFSFLVYHMLHPFNPSWLKHPEIWNKQRWV